jgi:hypothetical protein
MPRRRTTRVKGRLLKLPQWIEGRVRSGPFVVRVLAEAVIPQGDTSEPCFEPETLRWLDEIQRLADAGRIGELARYGTVYVSRSA